MPFLQQPTYALGLPKTLCSFATESGNKLTDICGQIEGILCSHPSIDSLHFFTHAGSDPEGESLCGKFVNRGNYRSALKRLKAIDKFVDNVVMLDVAPGEPSFQAETYVTAHFAGKYPHVRDATTSGKIVLINAPHNKGTWSSKTRVYVSFGQRLRECIEDQSIVVQAAGPTVASSCHDA